MTVIWNVYRLGWLETLKTAVKIIIPSALIILFNVKAGRILFRNPLVGILSSLPSAIFIFRISQPLCILINNWIDQKTNIDNEFEDIIETESISLDE